MKKAFLLSFLSLAVALSAFADDDDRHQSYLSYDDGGTIVKSGDDGREIEAHRNLPIYPGDEIVTARRGRAEVRLSDGNIIGIDRTTALRVRSVLDAYEGEDDETVAELRYGKVAVFRTDIGRQHVRIDTNNASYVAYRESVYSVETDSRGRDRVTVFDGSLEVRTPLKTTRLRSGETATIDDRGLFDLVGDQRTSADEFERWFLKRAERFDNYQNQYVDRRLGHYADDLDDHGRWVHVGGIGWTWRPYVSAGWRPYYNGYWHHGRGSLVWVSYDPWGWGTYHYGRWAHDPGFGWYWVPGYGYSPAWVYWTYGPSYVGWAPAGWWDCHRGYYNWAYHPYRNTYAHHGFGFYGRVRVNDFDLRPWTFVDSSGLVSTRIDRAALTTDAVKARLTRLKDGYAPVTGGPARFTREELRDPADAIRRRGIDGRFTGRETGANPVDMTAFVRRDPDVGNTIKDRIVRSRGTTPSAPAVGTPATPSRTAGGWTGAAGGVIGERRQNGGGSGATTEGGRITRGGSRSDEPATVTPRVIGGERGSGPRDADNGSSARDGAVRDWRNRTGDRQTAPPSASAPRSGDDNSGSTGSSWRDRVRSEVPRDSAAPAAGSTDRSRASGGSNDAPRRVIDRIGGARVVPRDSGSRDSGSRDSGSARNSGSRSERGSRDSGSSGNVRNSGGSGSRESARPAPPPPSNSGGSSGSSGSSGRSSSGGGNREGGGQIKRDQ
jgi:hypothetical protein